MRVEAQEKQSGLSNLRVATYSAIVAMAIASVALFIPNARLWTILFVGILVFLLVLFIISFNRYLWMARIALGGMALSSWVVKGVSAWAQIDDDTFVGIIVNQIRLQDSINLTIGFVVLIGADVFVHHIMPYLRERSTQSTERSKKLQQGSISQTIEKIEADTVNLTQVSALTGRNSVIFADCNALKTLLDREFYRGEEFGKMKIDAEQWQIRTESGDLNTKYIEILKSKADTLVSQIKDLIDMLEYEAAFDKAEQLEALVTKGEKSLPAESLTDLYIFLANTEITKVNWLNITKGKAKDLSKVRYFYEKAKNVNRKES